MISEFGLIISSLAHKPPMHLAQGTGILKEIARTAIKSSKLQPYKTTVLSNHMIN
jgi:hypothetical protein